MPKYHLPNFKVPTQKYTCFLLEYVMFKTFVVNTFLNIEVSNFEKYSNMVSPYTLSHTLEFDRKEPSGHLYIEKKSDP